jgi:hypothetical protein
MAEQTHLVVCDTMLEMTEDGKEMSVELMADDSAEKADEAVSVLDGSREEGSREAEMVEETFSEMVELASALLSAAVLRTSELKMEEDASDEASVLLGSAELRTSELKIDEGSSEEGSTLLGSAELAAEEGSSDDEAASVLLAPETTEEGALDGTALEGSAEETTSEEVGAAEEIIDEGAAEEVDAMTVDVAPEPGMSSYMSRRPPAPQNCCYEKVSLCHQGLTPFR